MNRFRAGLTHLGLSAAIAAAIFLPIYFVWFPDVLFESAGGRDLFFLVACVDVTLGPLITFVVFVPGKKGLVFDLVVIATLQLAALAYGAYVLFESRPVYLVFVKDRFELVRANQIPDENLEQARAKGNGYDRLPVTGPRVVAARIPEDPNESFRIMMSGFAGVDLQSFPAHYLPYDAVRGEAKEKSAEFARLRRFNPGRLAEVDALLAKLKRPEGEVRYLPLRAGKIDLTVLIDAKNAEVLKLSLLRPWEY